MKPGESISHFRVIERVGSGGMGIVYKAEDERLHRTVALKVLPPECVGDPERRRRFLREAQAVAAVIHPNIATVFEAGEADGDIYMAMEFVFGQTLRARLQEGPMTASEAIRLGLQIADGLAQAHEAGIVHRDLKPENIMIDRAGRAKILDFGIAKLMASRDEEMTLRACERETVTQLTQPADVLGTPAYMSPEQVARRQVDHRSDQFALGVILVEMLTGSHPFSRATLRDTLNAIERDSPLDAIPQPRNVTRPLRRFLARCLAKNPESRFARTQELAVELEKAYAFSKRLRRIRLAATIASFVALPVIAWVVHSVRAPPEPAPLRREPNVLVLPFSYRGEGPNAYLGAAMMDLLGRKLDVPGVVRGVDPSAVARVLAPATENIDVDKAREIAGQLDARFYVTGSVVQAGPILQLGAFLYERDTLQPVVSESIEGAADSLLPLVDHLAARLLTRHWGDATLQLPELPTESLEALHAYLEAESHRRATRYYQAVESYQRAIAADSAFALAWYGLSQTVSPKAASAGVDRNAAAEQALRYAERLPAHLRKTIRATRVEWEDTAEAIRLLQEVVDLHPEMLGAWSRLGVLRMWFDPLRGESLEGARIAFEQAGDDDITSLAGHALYHIKIGHQTIAESLIVLLRQRAPQADYDTYDRTFLTLLQGDSTAVRDLVGELARLEDHQLFDHLDGAGGFGCSRPWLDYLPGDLLELATHPNRSAWLRAHGQLFAAELDVAHGRWTSARRRFVLASACDAPKTLSVRTLLSLVPPLHISREEFLALRDELRSMAPSDSTAWILRGPAAPGYEQHARKFLLGLVSVRLEDPVAAQSIAAELWSESENLRWAMTDRANVRLDKELRRLSLLLRAEVALSRGRASEAQDWLEAVPIYRTWYSVPRDLLSAHERLLRGRVLVALGREEEALAWYDTVGLEWTKHAVAYIAPAILERARLLDELGRGEEARPLYERFLSLWSDCDDQHHPLILEIEERLGLQERASVE